MLPLETKRCMARHFREAVRSGPKRHRAPLTAVILLLSNISPARSVAESAHFWISTSNTTTVGPSAPTIANANGAIRYLYIWARPATRYAGAYDATNNPFKVLQSFSLDLISILPTLDFLDNSIVVYNPSVNGVPRFETVSDSSNSGTTPPLISSATQQEIIDGAADRVDGIQGFTLFGDRGRGVGATCADEPYCITTSGVPTWLVASVGYRSVRMDASAEVFLQIGSNGMNHVGETSSLTTVAFGSDAAPVYTAGRYIDQFYNLHPLGDREMTFPIDTPDLVVQPGENGDFNGDGKVDAADYVMWRKSDSTLASYNTWRRTFGTTSQPGIDGDFNGDGNIDAADYVMWRKSDSSLASFNTWRSNFGRIAGGGQNFTIIPEPDAGSHLTIALCLVAIVLSRARLRWL